MPIKSFITYLPFIRFKTTATSSEIRDYTNLPEKRIQDSLSLVSIGYRLRMELFRRGLIDRDGILKEAVESQLPSYRELYPLIDPLLRREFTSSLDPSVTVTPHSLCLLLGKEKALYAFALCGGAVRSTFTPAIVGRLLGTDQCDQFLQQPRELLLDIDLKICLHPDYPGALYAIKERLIDLVHDHFYPHKSREEVELAAFTRSPIVINDGNNQFLVAKIGGVDERVIEIKIVHRLARGHLFSLDRLEIPLDQSQHGYLASRREVNWQLGQTLVDYQTNICRASHPEQINFKGGARLVSWMTKGKYPVKGLAEQLFPAMWKGYRRGLESDGERILRYFKECLSAHHEPYCSTQIVYLLNACLLFESELGTHHLLDPLWRLFQVSGSPVTHCCTLFARIGEVLRRDPAKIHEVWALFDLFAFQVYCHPNVYSLEVKVVPSIQCEEGLLWQIELPMEDPTYLTVPIRMEYSFLQLKKALDRSDPELFSLYGTVVEVALEEPGVGEEDRIESLKGFGLSVEQFQKLRDEWELLYCDRLLSLGDEFLSQRIEEKSQLNRLPERLWRQVDRLLARGELPQALALLNRAYRCELFKKEKVRSLNYLCQASASIAQQSEEEQLSLISWVSEPLLFLFQQEEPLEPLPSTMPAVLAWIIKVMDRSKERGKALKLLTLVIKQHKVTGGMEKGLLPLLNRTVDSLLQHLSERESVELILLLKNGLNGSFDRLYSHFKGGALTFWMIRSVAVTDLKQAIEIFRRVLRDPALEKESRSIEQTVRVILYQLEKENTGVSSIETSDQALLLTEIPQKLLCHSIRIWIHILPALFKQNPKEGIAYLKQGLDTVFEYGTADQLREVLFNLCFKFGGSLSKEGLIFAANTVYAKCAKKESALFVALCDFLSNLDKREALSFKLKCLLSVTVDHLKEVESYGKAWQETLLMIKQVGIGEKARQKLNSSLVLLIQRLIVDKKQRLMRELALLCLELKIFEPEKESCFAFISSLAEKDPSAIEKVCSSELLAFSLAKGFLKEGKLKKAESYAKGLDHLEKRAIYYQTIQKKLEEGKLRLVTEQLLNKELMQLFELGERNQWLLSAVGQYLSLENWNAIRKLLTHFVIPESDEWSTMMRKIAELLLAKKELITLVQLIEQYTVFFHSDLQDWNQKIAICAAEIGQLDMAWSLLRRCPGNVELLDQVINFSADQGHKELLPILANLNLVEKSSKRLFQVSKGALKYALAHYSGDRPLFNHIIELIWQKKELISCIDEEKLNMKDLIELKTLIAEAFLISEQLKKKKWASTQFVSLLVFWVDKNKEKKALPFPEKIVNGVVKFLIREISDPETGFKEQVNSQEIVDLLFKVGEKLKSPIPSIELLVDWTQFCYQANRSEELLGFLKKIVRRVNELKEADLNRFYKILSMVYVDQNYRENPDFKVVYNGCCQALSEKSQGKFSPLDVQIKIVDHLLDSKSRDLEFFFQSYRALKQLIGEKKLDQEALLRVLRKLFDYVVEKCGSVDKASPSLNNSSEVKQASKKSSSKIVDESKMEELVYIRAVGVALFARAVNSKLYQEKKRQLECITDLKRICLIERIRKKSFGDDFLFDILIEQANYLFFIEKAPALLHDILNLHKQFLTSSVADQYKEKLIQRWMNCLESIEKEKEVYRQQFQQACSYLSLELAICRLKEKKSFTEEVKEGSPIAIKSVRTYTFNVNQKKKSVFMPLITLTKLFTEIAEYSHINSMARELFFDSYKTFKKNKGFFNQYPNVLFPAFESIVLAYSIFDDFDASLKLELIKDLNMLKRFSFKSEIYIFLCCLLGMDQEASKFLKSDRLLALVESTRVFMEKTEKYPEIEGQGIKVLKAILIKQKGCLVKEGIEKIDQMLFKAAKEPRIKKLLEAEGFSNGVETMLKRVVDCS